MAAERDLSRISPVDLVCRTPLLISPSVPLVYGVAFAIYIVVCVIAFAALWQLWKPSVAVVLLGPLSFLWYGERVGLWAVTKYWCRQLERLVTQISKHEGGRGTECQVSGIAADTWVCYRNDYDQKCRAHRAENGGRRAGEPPVTYKLVVAAFPRSGNQRTVAFSNGTTIDWYTTANFIRLEHHFSAKSMLRFPSPGHEIATVATILLAIVGDLRSDPSGTTIQFLLKRHGHGRDREEYFWHAVRALCLWGLCRVAAPAGVRTLYGNSLGSLCSTSIRLTHAGESWHDATSEVQAKIAEERARMNPNRRPPKIVSYNYISQNSGIVNVMSDNHGAQTSNAYVASRSDDEVLGALCEILERSDIPWKSRELDGVRQTIEDSVSRRDAASPDLRRAVALLLQVCGSIGVGIAGNAAYEVLRTLVS